MIKNSDTIVSILIPVTKNEASCLPDTLLFLGNDGIRYGKKAEIIVIANCCKGTSDEVAQAIFSESAFKDSLVTGKVIHCETPGKMFAVNDGIDVANGQYLTRISLATLFSRKLPCDSYFIHA